MAPGLVVTAVAAVLLVVTCSASSNATEWWTQDHPYLYVYRYEHLPDGRVAVRNASRGSPAATNWREASKDPLGLVNWVVSKNGSRFQKDIKRLLLYNFVSPLDYGDSNLAKNNRAMRNRAMRTFLLDNAVVPAVLKLGGFVWSSLKEKYSAFIKSEIDLARLDVMTAEEIATELNVTLPPAEDLRPKHVLPYVWSGNQRRNLLLKSASSSFEPFPGYADQYYSPDDDLPPATIPAASYPWPWRRHLELARDMIFQLVGSSSDDDDDNASSEQSANGSAIAANLNEVASDYDIPARRLIDGRSDNTTSTQVAVGDTIDSDDLEALDRIGLVLGRFEFATGIPVLPRRNTTGRIFPTLDEFEFNLTNHLEQTDLEQVNDSMAGSWAASVTNSSHGRRNDTSLVVDVHTSLLQFYAYPAIAATLISFDDDLNDRSSSDCSIEAPCYVQSGVTVYTPLLANVTVFKLLVDPTKTMVDSQTEIRKAALVDMVKTAFEAEHESLRHGLQAPSTAWYSMHDMMMDELADAIVGSVANAKQNEVVDPSPLSILEGFLGAGTSALDEHVSYFVETLSHTHIVMEAAKTVPKPEAFSEADMVDLIVAAAQQMKLLDAVVAGYQRVRDDDPQHQRMVDATEQHAFYNGSQYTLLGFGYTIPATNEQNVMYRDMRLPIGFHLVLRLLVRFLESRLLLPDEARFIIGCLAIRLNNIPYYRCESTDTSADTAYE